MAVRNNRNPDARELYREGLPLLRFTKVVSSTSNQTSNHQAIDSFKIRPFTPLAQLNTAYTHDDFDNSSQILGHPAVRARHISFSSETDIQMLTASYFTDILTLGEVSDIMSLHNECSYTNELGKITKADHWAIYSKGRPVDVIAIKSPVSDADPTLPAPERRTPGVGVHVLDDLNVLGEIYDYILNLHSFKGQAHVFALLSTLKDFRVVWLPRSNDYAMSPETHRGEPVVDFADEFARRDLCGTGILSHTSPGLTQIMMSVILKSAASPFLPVHAFDARRMYLQMSAAAWTWSCLGRDAAGLHSSATLHLRSTARESAHFTIIKSVSRRHSCRVWLALAGAEMLCVVKQMKSVDLVTMEVGIWHDALGERAVFATVVQGAAAVVMPVAVLMHVIAGQVRYNTDFNSWAVDDNVTAGPVPPLVLAQLTTVANMLESGFFAGGIMEVANDAIAKCAMAGVLHTDLEWRHFGVVPVFDSSGTITSLLAVVIDFDHCQVNVDPAVALQTMRGRLAELAAGVII